MWLSTINFQFQALSEEEEDEIEASSDPKKHRNKLKAIGAAIQSLLKKHDKNKEESILKSDDGSETQKITTDSGTQKITTDSGTSKFAAESGTEKITTDSGTEKVTTDSDVAKDSSDKAKDNPVEILKNVLLKSAKNKNKSLLNNTSSDTKSSTVKFAKNESNDVDNLSNEGSKNVDKGQDGSKKKKGLSLGAAIARGDKPPCICPDKSKDPYYGLLVLLQSKSHSRTKFFLERMERFLKGTLKEFRYLFIEKIMYHFL